MILFAFLIILVQKSEESVGRLHPIVLDARRRTTLSSLAFVLRGCVTKPDKHGEGENTLNSGPIEVSHGCLADFKLLKLP